MLSTDANKSQTLKKCKNIKKPVAINKYNALSLGAIKSFYN